MQCGVARPDAPAPTVVGSPWRARVPFSSASHSSDLCARPPPHPMTSVRTFTRWHKTWPPHTPPRLSACRAIRA
eukprot:5007903-Prymnesium_polylepis.1